MVNETITNPGIIKQVQKVVAPVINLINGLLTQLIPGKEELVVIALALYLGWQWRSREWNSGGYDIWLKASIVIYIILKIIGLGNKLF